MSSDYYQKLAKEYIQRHEHWETSASEIIAIECFASFLDRKCDGRIEKDKREDVKVYEGTLPDCLNWCNPTSME